MFLLHFRQLFFFSFPLFSILVTLIFVPASTLARNEILLGGDTCFVETTGDNITDYSSADETALQSAIDVASFGALIKVAGTCAGTQAQGGRVLTAYINQTLTIRGGYDPGSWLAEPDPTSSPTTLDALQEGRVIFVNVGGHTVILRGLIIKGGDTSNGGGIENRSLLTLVESTVSGNLATGNGGGIFNQGGTVSLIDSTLVGNTATGAGGGIYSTSGDIFLSTSEITNNTSDSGAGGGIYTSGTGAVSLVQSTLSHNTANTLGGALYTEVSGLVAFTQSAVHHNTAGTQGGGIYIASGILNITNSTLSTNTANSVTQGGGAIASNGASISVQYATLTGNSAPFVNGQDGIWLNAGTMTIASSILGSNGTENCYVTGGNLNSDGYNLSSDSSCAFGQTGDQNNTNPNLGPLTNNGGPTLTHFLLPFSPAIDVIPNNVNNCGSTIAHDQRGISRPIESLCDKGAVELDTNYIPTANANTYNLNEDSALNITDPGVLSNDADGDWDSLTAHLNATVSNGSLTLNTNGSFSYTPAQNYCGADSFTYHAEDGQSSSTVTSVTLNIACVNDSPTAVNDSYETSENTPLIVPPPGVLENDQDIDHDPLTVVVNALPTHGTLILNDDGSFTYDPAENYCGPDSFTYFANDGSVNSNAATVSLTISCFNNPPIAVGDTYETMEDTPLTVSASGVLENDLDIEQETLTATLNLSPAYGTLALNEDGSFDYSPAENYCGSDLFTYFAHDGMNQSNSATVNLTITCVNDSPDVNAGSNQTVSEGQVVNLAGSFIDPETNTNPRIAWDFGDGSGTTGVLTPTHSYVDEGNFTVTLVVTDDLGSSDSDTLTVAVQNVPAVLGSIPGITVFPGVTVSFVLNYHDPGVTDTHTATVNWRDGIIEPAQVNPSSETITGTHVFYVPGNYSIVITVMDNDGAQSTATFSVTVSATPNRYLIYLPIAIE